MGEIFDRVYAYRVIYQNLYAFLIYLKWVYVLSLSLPF
jgi:hypothetical protein